MQEMQGMQVWSLSQEDPLEKEMATHSNSFAWKISWTEEPDRLQSMVHKQLDMTKHAHKQYQKKYNKEKKWIVNNKSKKKYEKGKRDEETDPAKEKKGRLSREIWMQAFGKLLLQACSICYREFLFNLLSWHCFFHQFQQAPCTYRQTYTLQRFRAHWDLRKSGEAVPTKCSFLAPSTQELQKTTGAGHSSPGGFPQKSDG